VRTWCFRAFHENAVSGKSAPPLRQNAITLHKPAQCTTSALRTAAGQRPVVIRPATSANKALQNVMHEIICLANYSSGHTTHYFTYLLSGLRTSGAMLCIPLILCENTPLRLAKIYNSSNDTICTGLACRDFKTTSCGPWLHSYKYATLSNTHLGKVCKQCKI